MELEEEGRLDGVVELGERVARLHHHLVKELCRSVKWYAQQCNGRPMRATDMPACMTLVVALTASWMVGNEATAEAMNCGMPYSLHETIMSSSAIL